MNTTLYKYFELVILFVFVPISLLFNYSFKIKFLLILLGFIYVIFVLIKIEKEKLLINKSFKNKVFWKNVLVKFLIVTVITTAFVLFYNRDLLFNVPLNNPKLWLIILFIYSVFSVYPQELIYRTFFFKRFQGFFKSQILIIISNAILFSLAHIFFRNVLVLVITFLGGLIFATTFINTQSTFLVSVEHAIYGCWLFTVGMGDMLGFPS